VSSIPIAEGAIEIERGADQGKVCEGLRKIAECLALRAGLLCEQLEVIGISLCLAKIRGTFEISKMQRGLVTCYMGPAGTMIGRRSFREAQIAGGTEMEKVTGIGRLFFRAHDPKALGRWYQEHLGVSLAPASYKDSVWQQEAGPTVFDPQPETSDLFGDAHKVWMVNFRVRDLDRMAAQLRAAGIKVEIDPQSYPNGRFASLHDLEGNPIQLWQPKAPDTKGQVAKQFRTVSEFFRVTIHTEPARSAPLALFFWLCTRIRRDPHFRLLSEER
jgi:predicted enzyme related to lactoylglutathione lyase